jgi:hypothetical protein
LGVLAAARVQCAFCGRSSHRGCVLVYGIDVVRESGSDDRARLHQHIRRHSPRGRPGFLVGQFAGATAVTLLFRWLVPTLPEIADDVVIPRDKLPV